MPRHKTQHAQVALALEALAQSAPSSPPLTVVVDAQSSSLSDLIGLPSAELHAMRRQALSLVADIELTLSRRLRAQGRV